MRAFVELPEEVTPEHALRQRRLARADREQDLVRGRQLLRDLKAGVAAADDEDAAVRYVVRPAVADGCASARRRRRGSSAIFGTNGIWNGPVATTTWSAVIVRSSSSRRKRPSSLRRARERAVQLDRQIEGLGVALEVGGHLVAGRIAIGVAREGQARQRAVATGREELQRVPALAPGSRRSRRRARGSRSRGPAARGSSRSRGRPGPRQTTTSTSSIA